jgi:hypothetical protein
MSLSNYPAGQENIDDIREDDQILLRNPHLSVAKLNRQMREKRTAKAIYSRRCVLKRQGNSAGAIAR